MPEVLEVGIDEFTLVLQTSQDISFEEWPGEIENMAQEFIRLSHIEELYGPLETADGKIQAGYTDGLTVTNRPWHFMLCWHDMIPKMGLCVRFSAYAYSAYKVDFEQKFQIRLNIALFLKMIASKKYTMRLSRIDFTADYKDYPNPRNATRYLDPHTLYNGLNKGDYVLKNYQDRQVIRKYSALDKNGAYETFYAGSRQAKTGGFLRCYDKRQEQIATHGFRYDEALKYESWVRFEAVFKGIYAHQITEQLQQIQTEDELKQLIAKHISDKYRFIDMATENPLKITEDLAGIVTNPDIATLCYPSARDNTLAQSIDYLKKGSGLYSVFYKVYLVWGEKGEKELLEHLQKVYEKEYKPKADEKPEIEYWRKKHWAELRGHDIAESFYETQAEPTGAPIK